MGELKDNLKKFSSFAGKGLAKGAKNVVSAVQETVKDDNRKKQIVGKMYEGTIKELARQRGLYPEPFFGGEPTIRDYRNAVVDNMSLKALIDFAKKKRIDIRDITDGIDEEKARKEQKELEEDASTSDEFKKVAKCVREFRPIGNDLREYGYQVQLAQYLTRDFPNTKIEQQRGSSRPDIVVNGIVIEIKGPTGDKELQTIADKLLRYPQRFPKGVIIALFNVYVTSYRYQEWYKGVGRQHPNVEVIKK